MRHFLLFSVFIGSITLFLLGAAFAKENVVRLDSNKDGKIDRITHFDSAGRILKLEVDSDSDGLMDRFQFYEDEKLIRIERDTDFNQEIDLLDYFKDQ